MRITYVLFNAVKTSWVAMGMVFALQPSGVIQTRGAAGAQPAVIEAVRIFSEAEKPHRIKQDKPGDFYLLCRGIGNSISAYDTKRNLLRTFGRQGIGPGEFRSPQDIAVDGAGLIYVADWYNNRVQIVDSHGKSTGQFDYRRPRTIALLGDDAIVVAGEPADHLFDIYTRGGNKLGSYGKPVNTGVKSSALNAALNAGRLYADGKGNILYLFQGLLKPVIRKYSRDGKLLQEIMVAGTGTSDLVARAEEKMRENDEMGQLGLSYTLNALAIDPATRNVWIATGNNLIYVYTPEGKKAGEFRAVDAADAKHWISLEDVFIAGAKLYIAGSQGCYVLDLPKLPGGGNS
jgi:hypothetical protein